MIVEWNQKNFGKKVSSSELHLGAVKNSVDVKWVLVKQILIDFELNYLG